MKKLIFMMIVALVSTGTMYAQEKAKSKDKGTAQKGKNATPEERAEKITTRLKTELSLTEEQTPKVKQSVLNRINLVAAAKVKAKEDKKAFGQERKKIFQAWEVELKGILTPEQYTTFVAKREEKKKKMKEAKDKKAADPAAENDEIDE